MHNNTEPPCKACHAHDTLEEKVDKNMNNNTKEHADILDILDRLAGDVHWMKIIGKWLLGTILTYFIALGIFIFTNDHATHSDLEKIEEQIEEGEDLHWGNERSIKRIEGQLDYLVDHMKQTRSRSGNDTN